MGVEGHWGRLLAERGTERALGAYAQSRFPEATAVTLTPLSARMGLDHKTLESFKQQLLGRVVALDTTFEFSLKAFFHLEVRITGMEPEGPCIVGSKTSFRAADAVTLVPAEMEQDFSRLDAGGQISELATLLGQFSKATGGSKINPEAQKWSLLALQRAKEGNVAGAIAAYQEALKTSTDWATYLGYGELLLSAGRVREAIAAFNFLLDLDVDMPEYLEKVAQIFHRYEEYDSLIKCCEKILALRPGNPFAWTMLGHARFRKGNVGGAIAAYEKPVTALPNQAATWANLATALLYANRTSEGLYCVMKALQLDPLLGRGNLGKIASLLQNRSTTPRAPPFVDKAPASGPVEGPPRATNSDEFISQLDPTLTVGEWVILMETEFLGLPGGDPDTSPFCFFYYGKPQSNKARVADIPNFDRSKLGWGLRGT